MGTEICHPHSKDFLPSYFCPTSVSHKRQSNNMKFLKACRPALWSEWGWTVTSTSVEAEECYIQMKLFLHKSEVFSHFSDETYNYSNSFYLPFQNFKRLWRIIW